MFEKATHKILCMWLAAGSPPPVYIETECHEFSVSRLEYWEPKWRAEKRTGQENPVWLQRGLLPFPKEQPPPCSLERGADGTLSTFIMLGGQLGKLTCPLRSPLQPHPWPSQATSRLSPQQQYQPLIAATVQVMSGLWPKGPDPDMDSVDHGSHLGSWGREARICCWSRRWWPAHSIHT